jgi:hypothetical protein
VTASASKAQTAVGIFESDAKNAGQLLSGGRPLLQLGFEGFVSPPLVMSASLRQARQNP